MVTRGNIYNIARYINTFEQLYLSEEMLMIQNISHAEYTINVFHFRQRVFMSSDFQFEFTFHLPLSFVYFHYK